MRHVAALPFFLKRSEDIIAAGRITSTAETIHGLLRLDGGADAAALPAARPARDRLPAAGSDIADRA
jgi:hypothetical protein